MRRRQTQFVDDHGFLVDTVQTANGFVYLRPRTKVQRVVDKTKRLVKEAPSGIRRSVTATAARSKSLWQRFIGWILQLLDRLVQRPPVHTHDTTDSQTL